MHRALRQHHEDLDAHAAIVFRMPTSGRNRPWTFRQRGASTELNPQSRVCLSDGEGIVEALKLGLGLCQIPDYFVADELAKGQLVEVLPSCRPEPLPIFAVYPSARLSPARVRAALGALGTLRRRA